MVKLSTATGYIYGYWQVDNGDGTLDNTWKYEMLDFDTGETAFSYKVSADPQYNNMAVGVIPSPDGNGLYCPSNTKGSEKYLTCLRDKFAYLSDGTEVAPENLGRKLLSDSEFQSASGTSLVPASYLMSADISGATNKTNITFQVNGLEKPAKDYTLYLKGSDGKFTPVDAEKWTLKADTSGNLITSMLYPLTIELDSGTDEISVVLAAESDTPANPSPGTSDTDDDDEDDSPGSSSSDSSSSGSSSSGSSSSGSSSSGSSAGTSDTKPSEVTTNTSGTTAKPPVTVSNESGAASAAISDKTGADIVQQTADNKSSQVVIAPEFNSNSTKTEVSIPSSTVNDIGSKTQANLVISTPVAEVTLPNAGLGNISEKGGDVIVKTEKKDNTVELTLTAGGSKINSVPGGVTLKVPVAAQAAPGTVAVLVKPDGTKEVIRKSTASNGTLSVPLEGSAKIEIRDNGRKFDDVPETNWAHSAISFASGHELFNGVSATLFAPDTTMTRGMLATVLHNLESNPKAANTSGFTDIGDTWYTEAVHWASEKGYVNGYMDGSFGPGNPITREQMATILYRYAEDTGNDVSIAEDASIQNFNDASDISTYALPAIQWACSKGIIIGKPGGVIDPQGNATRAEIASIIMRFMQR